MMLASKIDLIREVVGNITKENLKYIDSYIIKGFGIFSPSGGACEYALLPAHTHPSYMFVIAFDEYSGVKIDNIILKSRPNTIFCLGPNIPHQELLAENPPRYFVIMVAEDLLQKHLTNYPINIEQFNGKHVSIIKDVMGAIKRFIVEYECDFPAKEILLKTISSEILHILLRCYMAPQKTTHKISDMMAVNNSIEFMHQNLSQKLTVEEIASSANYSPSHFLKIFRNEVGKSPIEYLTRIRLEKSKKMLLNRVYSITDVALNCGFTNPSYFSDVFSKSFHESPSSYKKRLK